MLPVVTEPGRTNDADEATGEPGPDQVALLAKLLQLEEEVGERLGWDRPPLLLVLLMPTEAEPVLKARLVADDAWRDGPGFPPDQLATYALRFKVPPQAPGCEPITFASAPGGLAAVVLMDEGYELDATQATGRDVRAARAGVRTFSENPNRVEVRYVRAADVNGHVYMVNRRRGSTSQNGAIDVEPPTRTTRALARLARAGLAGTFPYSEL